MDKIKVTLLPDSGKYQDNYAYLSALLTMRGQQKYQTTEDLQKLVDTAIQVPNEATVQKIACSIHGTAKRLATYTFLIHGASRRFLAQIRTHQVGITFVSGSMQYADQSEAGYVVPFEVMQSDSAKIALYKQACEKHLAEYGRLVGTFGKDAAAYVAPQATRNVLLIQGNQQSLEYLIRLRSCKRNTLETQYIVLLMLEELQTLNINDAWWDSSLPECTRTCCPEGALCCKKPYKSYTSVTEALAPFRNILSYYPNKQINKQPV